MGKLDTINEIDNYLSNSKYKDIENLAETKNKVDEIIGDTEKKATKEQLKDLWGRGELNSDVFVSTKWKNFAIDWNNRYSREKGFSLPTSVNGMIGILGGSKKTFTSKDYIVSLLSGTKFIKPATKQQLVELWNNGELQSDNLGIGWKEYAQNWNNNHSKEKGFSLPVSLIGLLKVLGGDIKVSTTQKYMISLLNGTEFKNKRKKKITKKQLLKLWNDRELESVYFTSDKWDFFANYWNDKNSSDKNPNAKSFSLPISIAGLISILGGDIEISQSREYIISLFKGTEYIEEKTITKEQLLELWNNGEINNSHLARDKWKEFAIDWNQKNSKEKGFSIPISTEGIIPILGGDIKISTSKGYILSLFNQKDYIESKKATKEQLIQLWNDGEFTGNGFGKDWKDLAKNWNSKHSKEKGFSIPTSIRGLVSTLGGTIEISSSREYIASLFDGTVFLKPVTKQQLVDLWTNGELNSACFGEQWNDFVKDWNEKNAKERGFSIPQTISDFVKTIGGKKGIPISKQYIIYLLNSSKSEK